MTVVERDLAELEQAVLAGIPADKWLIKVRDYLRAASTPEDRNARKAAVMHVVYALPLARKV